MRCCWAGSLGRHRRPRGAEGEGGAGRVRSAAQALAAYAIDAVSKDPELLVSAGFQPNPNAQDSSIFTLRRAVDGVSVWRRSEPEILPTAVMVLPNVHSAEALAAMDKALAERAEVTPAGFGCGLGAVLVKLPEGCLSVTAIDAPGLGAQIQVEHLTSSWWPIAGKRPEPLPP